MNSNNRDALVLRGAVHAAVLFAGANLGVTAAQAEDIARRLIAECAPELTDIGSVRLTTGETLDAAMARLARDPGSAHLFNTSEAQEAASGDKAQRERLKSMTAAGRLEAANAGEGVTTRGALSFRDDA